MTEKAILEIQKMAERNLGIPLAEMEEGSQERDTQYANGDWSFHIDFWEAANPKNATTVRFDPVEDGTVYS